MSKDLDALECIVVDLTPIAKEHNKEEIEQVKKSLEVLDIIKEKEVDVHYLLICIEQNINPLQFYNEYMKEHNALGLTQEEFDLLKKTLIK